MSKDYTMDTDGQTMIWKTEYDAPVEDVYRAYTDPRMIREWLGPRGLTTVVEKLEVRPGGQWREVSQDEQGNIYAFHGVFHDVVAPRRLVRTNEYEGAPGHVSLETATFEEREGRTYVTIRAIYDSEDDLKAAMGANMEEGMRQSRERLDELLRRAA